MRRKYISYAFPMYQFHFLYISSAIFVVAQSEHTVPYFDLCSRPLTPLTPNPPLFDQIPLTLLTFYP